MVSISSEASATDNIPTLVTSLATIQHRAEQLLAGGGAPAVPKQKYFDDRDGRKEKTVNNKETAGERKTGWPTFEQKTLYKYPDIYRCYIEFIVNMCVKVDNFFRKLIVLSQLTIMN